MKTLQEALALVPTYWPLAPGMDKWKEGDEYRLIGGDLGWRPGDYTDLTGAISGKYEARRPIPQSVREAEARWILYKELRFTHYPSSQVKVYSTRVQDNGVLICTDCAWGIFPNDIENLGGVIAVQDMLTEGPGALWRWVEENRK